MSIENAILLLKGLDAAATLKGEATITAEQVTQLLNAFSIEIGHCWAMSFHPLNEGDGEYGSTIGPFRTKEYAERQITNPKRESVSRMSYIKFGDILFITDDDLSPDKKHRTVDDIAFICSGTMVAVMDGFVEDRTSHPSLASLPHGFGY